MTRVLMVTDLYPPVVGGLELHVQGLARELVARGHHVAVATRSMPGQPPEAVEDGVHVHRIDGWSRLLDGRYERPEYRFHPPLPDPGMVRALDAVVRAERPDVLHAHAWMLYSAVPVAVRRRLPIVVTLHDYGLVCARKTFLHDGEAPCPGPSLRRCASCAVGQYGPARAQALVGALRTSGALHRRVDRFLAVSRAVRDAVVPGIAGRRCDVVPNFLPDAVAGLGADGPRPAFLPAEDGYLLLVGALSRHKGVEVMLDAHARLRAAGAAPPLVLVGPATPEIDLSAPPAGVHVQPGASRDDVMRAFRGALAAVVPSTWGEPCPTVAMEALAVGTPVVASAIGGLPDIVADGTSGLLVPAGDAGALAAALGRLVAEPALRARLAAAAPGSIDGFRAGSVVGRIEQAYADVIAARRG